MVIGLAQTLDYARAMMSGKMSRQAWEQLIQIRRDRETILDTDRHFTLLHAEGALRWHIGSPTVMAAQLDYLADITRWPRPFDGSDLASYLAGDVCIEGDTCPMIRSPGRRHGGAGGR